MQPTEPKTSIKVFISYAHADQEMRKKLEEHLSSLSYSGKISIWQDQEIPAGANWQDRIDTHINEADIILLLISASFIASNYCWNKEVLAALERHKAGTAQVIPVILKPALWEETPIGQIQALPTGAKPVTQWNDQDAAFDNVARGIRKVVEGLLKIFREEAERKEKTRKPVKPRQASRLIADPELKILVSTSINKEATPPLPPVPTTADVVVSRQKSASVPYSSLQDPSRNVLPSSPQKQHRTPAQPKRQRIVLVLLSLTLVLVVASSLARIYFNSQDNTNSLGRTWHSRTSGTAQLLSVVAWSSSQFVAVGSLVGGGGTILTSSDGLNWTDQAFGWIDTPQDLENNNRGDLDGIASSGSLLVAVGTGGIILTSSNGINWFPRNPVSSQDLYGVAWLDSQFVAVGQNGTILTSPDGFTWTSRTSGIAQPLSAVAWSGSQFVAVGTGGIILTSPNGISWTARTSPALESPPYLQLHSIAWSGSQFVAVGENRVLMNISRTILTSPNGISWTLRSGPDILNGIAWSGSQFVAVGGNGAILTSPDGFTWTVRTSGTSQTLNGIAWSGSRFVAVGDIGTTLTSP